MHAITYSKCQLQNTKVAPALEIKFYTYNDLLKSYSACAIVPFIA